MRGATRKEKWMATQVFLTACCWRALLWPVRLPVKVTPWRRRRKALHPCHGETGVHRLQAVGRPRGHRPERGDVTAAVQSGGHHPMVSPALHGGIAGWSAAHSTEGTSASGASWSRSFRTRSTMSRRTAPTWCSRGRAERDAGGGSGTSISGGSQPRAVARGRAGGAESAHKLGQVTVARRMEAPWFISGGWEIGWIGSSS